MPTTTVVPVNTCNAMANGVTATTGLGAQYQLIVGGTWVTGDQYTIILNDTASGFTTQIGAGFATGVQPIQVFTYGNKVYAISGINVNSSGIAQPTVWNDPNGASNGNLALTNYFASNENLVAMAAYQGKLAFWSQQTIQIFSVSASFGSWAQAQVLPNMGTLATNSVQSLGDLDVLFLNQTGIRSLRVRDSSLYAFINDIGTPIDSLIQASIAAGTTASNAAACAVVDPQSGRYWLYLNGVIYVLSYYPSTKITAWATYLPTYVSTKDGATHTATISLFVTFNGQVYARAHSDEGDLILQYGGSSGNQYDTTVATVATTWLDLQKPNVNKRSTSFSGALSVGETTQWTVSAGMNQYTGNLQQITKSGATFGKGQIPFVSEGFQIKIQAVSSGTGPAILSSLVWEYELAETE